MDIRVKEGPSDRRWRLHSVQFKAEVVKACRHPGVRMAAVALASGLNANVPRRWVRQAEQTGLVAPAAPGGSEVATNPEIEPAFVPLALPTREPEPATETRIELCRGANAVTVTWPAAATAECARCCGLIRAEEIWLAVTPMDMRVVPDTALARVV